MTADSIRPTLFSRTVTFRWTVTIGLLVCALLDGGVCVAEETTTSARNELDQSELALSTQHIKVACEQRCSDQVSPSSYSNYKFLPDR